MLVGVGWTSGKGPWSYVKTPGLYPLISIYHLWIASWISIRFIDPVLNFYCVNYGLFFSLVFLLPTVWITHLAVGTRSNRFIRSTSWIISQVLFHFTLVVVFTFIRKPDHVSNCLISLTFVIIRQAALPCVSGLLLCFQYKRDGRHGHLISSFGSGTVSKQAFSQGYFSCLLQL